MTLISESNNLNKCSPHDLIETALGYPGKGLDALYQMLRAADKDELDWLEFKAVTVPADPERRKLDGDVPLHEYYWHCIVRPVLALANNMGGALIVGIEDKDKNVVGLSESQGWEKSGGHADKFLLSLKSVFEPENGVWSLSNNEKIRLLQPIPDAMRQARIDTIEGKPVLVIVVRPVPLGGSLLGAEKQPSEVEIYPVRMSGDKGQVKDVKKASEKESVEKNRILVRSDLSVYLDNIKNQCESLKEREVVTGRHLSLDEDVENYKNWVEQQFVNFAQAIPLSIRQENLSRLSVESPEPATQIFLGDVPASSDLEGLESALKISRRFALLGEPGSGKSWVLQNQVLKQMAGYRSGGKVSIYVPLKNFRPMVQTDDHFMGLSSLLERSTDSLLQRGQLLQLASDGRLVIYFDGLGECPESYREALVRSLNDLFDSRNFPTVIACRQLDYAHEDFDEPLGLFVIRPLNDFQQRKLVQNWLSGSTIGPDQFIAEVNALEGGYSLLTTPLILRLLCDLTKRGETLTTNRAKLWEAFLRHWYMLEFQERKSGGAQSLRWEDVRDALGLIAMAAKREGNVVEIPLEQANAFCKDTLDIKSRDELFHAVESGGGRLFSIRQQESADYFVFEDAVFRDYLAAVYLVAHPITLEEIKTGVRQTDWELSLSFACELGATDNAEFIRLAWEIDPLLVSVAAPNDKFIDEIVLPDNPWVAGIVSTMLGKEVEDYSLQINESFFMPPPPDLLARLSSASFWQIFSKSEVGKERIARFKALVVKQPEPWADLLSASKDGLGDKEWIVEYEADPMLFAACGISVESWQYDADIDIDIDPQIIARGVLTSSPHTTDFLKMSEELAIFFNDPNLISDRQWHLLVEAVKSDRLSCNIGGKIVLDTAFNLLTAGPLIQDAFDLCDKVNVQLAFDAVARSQLAEECEELQAAIQLVNRKILSASDFPAERLSAWLDQATPKSAVGMMQCGLIGKNSIPSEKIDSWVRDANLDILASFADSGIGSRETLRRYILEKVMGATPSVAIQIVKSGVVSAKDIPDVLKLEWVNSQTISSLIDLTVKRVISSEDMSRDIFSNVAPRLALEATTSQAIELFKTGTLSKENLRDRCKVWVNTASAIDAVRIVKAGLLTKEEFKDRTKDFVKQIEQAEAPITLVCQMADAELVTRDDLPKALMTKLRRDARPLEGIRLINVKLVNESEFFTVAKARWIEESATNPSTAISLFKKNLYPIEEFEGFVQEWLRVANGGQIALLIPAGLLDKSDISVTHKMAWLEAMNPAHILLLLQCGALLASDFSDDQKNKLFAISTSGQLSEFAKYFENALSPASLPVAITRSNQIGTTRSTGAAKKVWSSKPKRSPAQIEQERTERDKMKEEVDAILAGTFGDALPRAKVVRWLELCSQIEIPPKRIVELCRRGILSGKEINVVSGYDLTSIQQVERIVFLTDSDTGEMTTNSLAPDSLLIPETREKLKGLVENRRVVDKKRLTCQVMRPFANKGEYQTGVVKHAIFGSDQTVWTYSHFKTPIKPGDMVVCELSIKEKQDAAPFFQLRVLKHLASEDVNGYREKVIPGDGIISLKSLKVTSATPAPVQKNAPDSQLNTSGPTVTEKEQGGIMSILSKLFSS